MHILAEQHSVVSYLHHTYNNLSSFPGEVLHDLKGHGGPIYKCRYFPSGVVVLSAGADGSCRIWSAESGINPVTLIGHKMAITDISIVDKGRNVISVSK